MELIVAIIVGYATYYCITYIFGYKNKVQLEKYKEEQRISFAYGNTKIGNPDITKEMVREAARKIDEEAKQRKRS